MVTRAQLLDVGLTRNEITHRIRVGQLVAVHRGVYLVAYGPRPPLAREAAAVLACAPDALLSHRTAARLWGLPVASPRTIEITVVGRHQRAHNGVAIHKIRELHRTERRRFQGLPITSPALTLLDLSGLVSADSLQAAVHEARVKRLVTDSQLRATLERHPRRRGARQLRALLEREGGARLTRSVGEREVLALLRRSGIEPDATNYRIGPYEVDFWFARERVALEFDSRRYHDNPTRFHLDRVRARYLAALGILHVAITDDDLGPNWDRTVREFLQTLRARRRRGKHAPLARSQREA